MEAKIVPQITLYPAYEFHLGKISLFNSTTIATAGVVPLNPVDGLCCSIHLHCATLVPACHGHSSSIYGASSIACAVKYGSDQWQVLGGTGQMC